MYTLIRTKQCIILIISKSFSNETRTLGEGSVLVTFIFALRSSFTSPILFISTELIILSPVVEEIDIDDTDKEVTEFILLSVFALFEIFERKGFLFVVEEKEYVNSLLEKNKTRSMKLRMKIRFDDKLLIRRKTIIT